MLLVELGVRVIGFVFSKSGLGAVTGALFASFLMIHSPTYNDFFYEVNDYVIQLYYLILGGR